MTPPRLAGLACAGLLAGCGGGGARPAAEVPPPATPADPVRSSASDWRSIATEADRRRLRDWRMSWTAALARLSGDTRVAAQGALLQPDAALPDAAPPPGAYRCRVTKLGAQAKGGLDYVAYPAFNCRIAAAGAALAFTKLDGSQRPVGLLYPDGGQRMVFLGAMMLGDERRAQSYGRDPERDVAGLLERIGPKRWRLAMPAPRWESLIDVMELVPAG